MAPVEENIPLVMSGEETYKIKYENLKIKYKNLQEEFKEYKEETNQVIQDQQNVIQDQQNVIRGLENRVRTLEGLLASLLPNEDVQMPIITITPDEDVTVSDGVLVDENDGSKYNQTAKQPADAMNRSPNSLTVPNQETTKMSFFPSESTSQNSETEEEEEEVENELDEKSDDSYLVLKVPIESPTLPFRTDPNRSIPTYTKEIPKKNETEEKQDASLLKNVEGSVLGFSGHEESSVTPLSPLTISESDEEKTVDKKKKKKFKKPKRKKMKKKMFSKSPKSPNQTEIVPKHRFVEKRKKKKPKEKLDFFIGNSSSSPAKTKAKRNQKKKKSKQKEKMKIVLMKEEWKVEDCLTPSSLSSPQHSPLSKSNKRKKKRKKKSKKNKKIHEKKREEEEEEDPRN